MLFIFNPFFCVILFIIIWWLTGVFFRKCTYEQMDEFSQKLTQGLQLIIIINKIIIIS